ncbi:YceI family protein [Williamwhitmania taraxaci]|uniref:YceI-like domain-containing protein n=1 Tax=Williamwhitmania taraxaci TaxID=1640674 RepID=A0A1G6GIH5_9BACT|nr:YceI family protein [Williamwhitmania taraxaci]SDB81555.1 YceI-like domain-containing protein [Williamwhitmania taraxaci]
MKYFIVSLLMLTSFSVVGQSKYITKNGYIDFFSKSSMEDISAKNEQVSSILDTENGKVVIAVLMKSFRFEKALMEEHFNENYVESGKFPKASFSGSIVDYHADAFKEGVATKVKISGDLTIHGVTKPILAEATIIKTKEGINAESQFVVKLKDFDIVIPALVKDKISEEVKISVKFNYLPLKK